MRRRITDVDWLQGPTGEDADKRPGRSKPGRGAVLIVDDDSDFRLAIETLLVGQGVGTTCVRGASEALRALARKRYDLVISDVMMPGRSGYQLLEQVRRVTDVPFLLISSVMKPHIMLRQLRSVANVDFLEKPVQPTALLQRVARYLPEGCLADPPSCPAVRRSSPRLSSGRS